MLRRPLFLACYCFTAISQCATTKPIPLGRTSVRLEESNVTLPLVEGQDIQFKRLNSAGLSQTRVAQIIQDDQGFIWFGTQNGLSRYDGYRFKNFRHNPDRQNSLSGVYIYSLFKDRSGTIWAGSDQFLDRFDPVTETFTRYEIAAKELNESSPVNFASISQDRFGSLWLSTRNGLYRLDTVTGNLRHYRHDVTDPFSLSDNDVKMADEDRQGNFWVSTSSGLDKFDRASGKVLVHIPFGDSGTGLWFHEDRYGVFWVIYGADGRIAIYDRKANRLSRLSLSAVMGSPPVTGPFYTMLEDRTGTMWFGTGTDGLLKFDRTRNQLSITQCAQVIPTVLPTPG